MTNQICGTCGNEYNCPDCGVWLERADYEDTKRWAIDSGGGAPALTRILSEEAAPAEAAPVDAPTLTTDICGGCGGEGDCGLCGVWHSYEEYADTVAFKATNGYHAPAVKTMMGVGEAAPVPTDPRDAELEALRSEVAALRDAHQRITNHIEGVLRYENVGPTEFFRGTCGAYKTVLGIINTTKDTRTNSTLVES